MNFPGWENHLACVSQQLQAWVVWMRKKALMNFPRPEKIMWPLSGRNCGFGKAGWGESVHDDFSEGHKKHLACLATDVDHAVEEGTPQ